ncbi:hypothetical protein [Nocardia sp. NPDC051570]|uniref:hypothetical protein n=1 Tax=Nocardia sp. NPDC051570 TaxID=3364324 RepID=UPI0037889129
MTTRYFRTLALLAAAAPLGAALIGLAPAQAASGDLSCSASLSLAFQPALVAGGQSTATITGTTSNCTSSNGQHTDLTSGTVSGSGAGTGASSFLFPCGVQPSGNGTATITWSSGATSTIGWQTSGTSFSATVTAGQLQGDALQASVNGAPQATCAPDGGMAGVSADVSASFA